MNKDSRDQPNYPDDDSPMQSDAISPTRAYSQARLRDVYVAGPVVRGPADDDEWTESVFEQLQAEARKLGVRLVFPLPEPELEKAEPRAFFQEVSARIGGADAVISVFVPDDRATVVEASVAAMYGKPQLIIARFPDDVPRMLRGMPAEVEVSATPRNRQRTITDFLSRARGTSRDDERSRKSAPGR